MIDLIELKNELYNTKVNEKPKHDLKKTIESLGALNKVTESLDALEEQVKKQKVHNKYW